MYNLMVRLKSNIYIAVDNKTPVVLNIKRQTSIIPKNDGCYELTDCDSGDLLIVPFENVAYLKLEKI